MNKSVHPLKTVGFGVERLGKRGVRGATASGSELE
jgi:hypothetical protein